MIVLVNKMTLKYFPYAMSLTLCHNVVAAILLSVKAGRLRPEKDVLPSSANWWWASLSVCGIYSQNLSLRTNSVTLYQITKLMTIPTQCMYVYLVQSKVYTRWVYGSLVGLIFGVALSTLAELDTRATAIGVVIAAVAVLGVVLEQGECSRLIGKYQMDSTDFMLSSSLHRSAVSAMMVLLLERDVFQTAPQLPMEAWAYVLLSCVLAAIINLTAAEIIRLFGPVTKAVLGQAKTTMILAAGFWMHPPAFDFVFLKHMFGIVVALGGAVKYAQYTGFPEANCLTLCRREAHPHELIVDVEEANEISERSTSNMGRVLGLVGKIMGREDKSKGRDDGVHGESNAHADRESPKSGSERGSDRRSPNFSYSEPGKMGFSQELTSYGKARFAEEE